MVAKPWIDLATNQAGAEAREQAVAAKDAAPVRTLFARALGVHTDERAWRIGADGEEKVAARLAKVAKKDPRWRFIHAIPVGNRGSDIDHLIIGPGGVFTVNAKHHPGAKIWVGGNTFMVNGVKQPYVRNARHEASRAADILAAACGFPVHVEGVIVTVNADDVVVKSQPEGVSVVPAHADRQVAASPWRGPQRGRHRSNLRGGPPVHHLAPVTPPPRAREPWGTGPERNSCAIATRHRCPLRQMSGFAAPPVTTTSQKNWEGDSQSTGAASADLGAANLRETNCFVEVSALARICCLDSRRKRGECPSPVCARCTGGLGEQ